MLIRVKKGDNTRFVALPLARLIQVWGLRPQARCVARPGYFGRWVRCGRRNESRRPPPGGVAKGVAETATPSTTPPQRGRRMPGLELRSKVAQPETTPELAGTGAMPVPLRSDHRRGRRMPAGRPQTRVSAAAQRQRDKARVVTLLHADQDCRLPCVRAVVMTSRTSVGVETDLPATSRMTSPVEKP